MLKKIMKLFETMFMAVSFAEAGEFDTAREILRQANIDRKNKVIRPQPRQRIQMRT